MADVLWNWNRHILIQNDLIIKMATVFRWHSSPIHVSNELKWNKEPNAKLTKGLQWTSYNKTKNISSTKLTEGMIWSIATKLTTNKI